MEQDEAWTTGHCYFDMSDYWQWRVCQGQEQEVSLPHSAYCITQSFYRID
jgi:hypothetical protein